jgi:hypothetical protein
VQSYKRPTTSGTLILNHSSSNRHRSADSLRRAISNKVVKITFDRIDWSVGHMLIQVEEIAAAITCIVCGREFSLWHQQELIHYRSLPLSPTWNVFCIPIGVYRPMVGEPGCIAASSPSQHAQLPFNYSSAFFSSLFLVFKLLTLHARIICPIREDFGTRQYFQFGSHSRKRSVIHSASTSTSSSCAFNSQRIVYSTRTTARYRQCH